MSNAQKDADHIRIKGIVESANRQKKDNGKYGTTAIEEIEGLKLAAAGGKPQSHVVSRLQSIGCFFRNGELRPEVIEVVEEIL